MEGAIITKSSILIEAEFLDSLLKTLEYAYARHCIMKFKFSRPLPQRRLLRRLQNEFANAFARRRIQNIKNPVCLRLTSQPNKIFSASFCLI